MTPTPDLEIRTAQALADEGAPADLAPQLCAIADKFGIPAYEVLGWIRFRAPGREWSGAEFQRFAEIHAALSKAAS